MSSLLDAIPYILSALAFVGSLFELAKKKKEHGEKPIFRIGALIVLCLAAILTPISLHHDNAQKQRESQDQRDSIKRLEGEAEAAIKAQTGNTALYLGTYKSLSHQVSELQAQVTDDALQKRLAAVQDQLQATEKAMVNPPKASLEFTFWPFLNPVLNSGVPIALNTDIIAPVGADDIVHFDFTVVNMTETEAQVGSITLGLCDLCTYVKEPDGSTNPAGSPINERMFPFAYISARTHFNEHSVDMRVPINATEVSVGIQYRCKTCDVPHRFITGTIRLKRDFQKPF
jgi:hypothetical protein